MTILILFIILYITYYISKRWKYMSLPSPGIALPFIGHVYLLLSEKFKNDQVNSMWNLWKKHQRNGLMYLKSFGVNMVFIGDFDTLKEVYNHPEVQMRMSGTTFEWSSREERKVKSKEIPGVILSEGKTWVEQRRFALRTLRDFGFGKQGMEEMIQEEVDMFKALIDKNKEEPFDFINQLNLPILNALWRITVGERFEYDDPKLQSIVHRLTETFQRLGRPENILIFAFPWLAKLYPGFMERDKTLEVNHDIMDMMAESVEQHQATLDVNAPRDFTDTMLIEIKNTTDKSSSFHSNFGIENLKNVLFDLFLAGSETTSTTLTWSMLYMIKYPEIQAQVQAELDTVVGQNRHPCIKDRSSLPFTEAVLMEVQRCANIVPNGVNHLCTRDFTINGITIPAHTLISPLLTNLLKGDYWGDGTTFRPQRFLDEDGNVVRDDHLIPFSIGKRQCLGETLAKVELFLFFTNLVHQYKLYPETEGQIVTEDYQPGVTILPKPFKVKLVNRLNN